MSTYEPYTGRINDIAAEEIDQRLNAIAGILGEEADLTGNKKARFERLMQLQEEWGDELTGAEIPETVHTDQTQVDAGDPDTTASDSATPGAGTTDPDPGDNDPDPEGDQGEPAAADEDGRVRIIADRTFQVFDADANGNQVPVFCSRGKPVRLSEKVAQDVIDAGAGHRG